MSDVRRWTLVSVIARERTRVFGGRGNPPVIRVGCKRKGIPTSSVHNRLLGMTLDGRVFFDKLML